MKLLFENWRKWTLDEAWRELGMTEDQEPPDDIDKDDGPRFKSYHHIKDALDLYIDSRSREGDNLINVISILMDTDDARERFMIKRLVKSFVGILEEGVLDSVKLDKRNTTEKIKDKIDKSKGNSANEIENAANAAIGEEILDSEEDK